MILYKDGINVLRENYGWHERLKTLLTHCLESSADALGDRTDGRRSHAARGKERVAVGDEEHFRNVPDAPLTPNDPPYFGLVETRVALL